MIPLLVTGTVGLDLPHAIPAPCVAFAPLHDPPPSFDSADLLVASPRAVHVEVPRGWRVLALSPATAAALRTRGVRVDAEVAGGGAELARAAGPGPVVFATSDLGGDEILRVRPDAHKWVVYRTVCPPALPAEALAVLAGEFDVLFASPSAVVNFESLAPGAILRARRVLCFGGTTLRAARHHRPDAFSFLADS